eukprot:CAMPEP_0117003060 /NCGR_PEP_ID=MMETSP0472-20121206/4507_1 /TAXON_ID=693140 ORGANISM="Tiarina fusus, Strain LIS" /NCGR_SAMPLE_ID=MMETSP0472 /ASSEMBLY_ACC=CAM_ASM_000603 /LENGTH=1234 /DNA_ID=CAMNT_0004703585 /DNA_START=297 /DNA_END=4001 /DNA_ORIENTATION=-
MHDVTGSELIARLDLPTKDLMSKAENLVVGGSTDVDLHSSDPAFETSSDTTSVGPDYEPTGGDPDPSSFQTGASKDVPEPVTPETPTTNELRKAFDVDATSDQVAKVSTADKQELQNMALGEVRPHRKRIVSLDRANQKDGYNSPTAATDGERRRRHHSARSFHSRSHARSRHDDDASSSDDDSSYFATHLPSPKSGRSFSLSSTGSAPAAPMSFYQNGASRESDASLSFSDESDDDVHHSAGVHVSPMIQPKGAVADMHLYPQRITRMHSVSSLVSSGSSEGGHGNPQASGRTSASSVSSFNTTSSDPDVRAELHDMAIAAHMMSGNQMADPSGRRSPVMGHQGYFFGHSPNGGVGSPPPISQGYTSSAGVAHPQPMTHEQMTAWASSGHPATLLFPEGRPIQGYGSSTAAESGRLVLSGETGFRSTSDNSNFTFPLVYSEDDETETGHLINRMTGGQAFGGPQDFNGGGQHSYAGPNQSNQNQSGGGYQGGKMEPTPSSSRAAVKSGSSRHDSGEAADSEPQQRGFKVYWQRWVMLFYMSILNLLSDWTCYSVAPIALLTEKAFGDIDPEKLVVVFLGANAISTACEPIILARLGLRRTVLFGALFLMIGSVVKSGGIPPILQTDLEFGHSEWRLYLGFFLVGLSQPLYQCTPALLSASWFPEKERTMATGVALNANQLGIGCAFIFGTLLVENANDIPGYFGLLSTLSTIVFLGTLIQFDDAPPTPPSSSARVMKGSLAVNLPSIDTIVQSVRGLGSSDRPSADSGIAGAPSPSPSASHSVGEKASKGGRARRRVAKKTSKKGSDLLAPSPMMPGRVGHDGPNDQPNDSSLYRETQPGQDQLNQQPDGSQTMPPPAFPGQPYPGMVPPDMGQQPGGQPGQPYPAMVPPFGAMPHPQYQIPYWDPRVQQQMQQQQAYYQQQLYYYQQQQQPQAPQQAPPPLYYPYPYPHPMQGYDMNAPGFSMSGDIDEGAEPIVTITNHHLDIHIRDDQVIRSTRACLSRPGFIHALVSFTVSGIVINTLSTFMDYLVRLNGAPRTYTGIVGGSFQFIIMMSSLIIGGQTDKTRAYYSVTIGMLVVGAFGLAECGVSLDADRGRDLRWSLLVVAALVGPLQPVSTELGVEVAYPLSENTVLVIQQLFSNLLSALFIPFFKALKDVGASTIEGTDIVERPQYTFSFYLLIVLHTGATVFFATFNGKYLRYEHELQKEAEEDRKEMEADGVGEQTPLLNNPVV